MSIMGDTHDGGHPHSGVSLSLKKEGHSDTCYNVEEPRGCYAQLRKPRGLTHVGAGFMETGLRGCRGGGGGVTVYWGQYQFGKTESSEDAVVTAVNVPSATELCS